MIPDQLIGYAWRIERILDAMREWISQDDFDDFARIQYKVPGCVDIISYGMIILHPENTWLSLLIEMVKADLVDVRETDGTIYYRAKAMMRNSKP